MSSPFIVASFYKFHVQTDYQLLREPLLAKMNALQIKGTIILAHEGINGSICGTPEQAELMMAHLRTLSGFESLRFLINEDESNPFTKAKVKLRKEIVTMGVEGINPEEITGTYLNPEQWNELLKDDEVVLIDTRNDYEVMLGTFKGAINPKTDNFRDFPEYVAKNLSHLKDKKIAMCCTGGIRCEKSTSYLKTLGFENVYQLHGGILTYLETIPKEESLWEGACFVFDNRVAVDADLNSFEDGTIDKEWKNIHRQSESVASNG